MSGFSNKSPLPLHRHPAQVQMARNARQDWHLIFWEYLAHETERTTFDRDIVNAIRQMDPSFLPLVARTVWRAPSGGVKVFEHVALAYQTHEPRMKRSANRIHNVRWSSNPASVNANRVGKGVVILEGTLEGPLDHLILPGPFRPLSWGLVKQMQAGLHENRNAGDLDPLVEAEKQKDVEQEKKRQQGFAEIDYRIDHDAGDDFMNAAKEATAEDWARLGWSPIKGAA